MMILMILTMMIVTIMIMMQPEEHDRTLVQCGSHRCQCCKGIPRTRNQTCELFLFTIMIKVSVMIIMVIIDQYDQH